MIKTKVLAICGGVGGAKLALGLTKILAPDELTIVANTADDFEHWGLSISPDLDTVMYTLAEINDKQQGWGLADESWRVMEAMAQLGGETWFRLGDKDLATHIERTRRLKQGQTLTEVTACLCSRLGVKHTLLPMSDDPVRTLLQTDQGELAFQQYFVREQCRPTIQGYAFQGIEQANPNPALLNMLAEDDLTAIVICPSNPFVSVEPVLRLRGIREALGHSSAPIVAVSPIVGGRAIKGPAAKMMAELNVPATALAVAEFYGTLLEGFGLDGFVLDGSDSQWQPAVEKTGVRAYCTQTVMNTLDDRIALAKSVLSFSQMLERK